MCLMNMIYDNGISIELIFVTSIIIFNGSGKNKPVIKKAMVELDGMCTGFLGIYVLESFITSLFKMFSFAMK